MVFRPHGQQHWSIPPKILQGHSFLTPPIRLPNFIQSIQFPVSEEVHAEMSSSINASLQHRRKTYRLLANNKALVHVYNTSHVYAVVDMDSQKLSSQ